MNVDLVAAAGKREGSAAAAEGDIEVDIEVDIRPPEEVGNLYGKKNVKYWGGNAPCCGG